jgi:hypothetical protein
MCNNQEVLERTNLPTLLVSKENSVQIYDTAQNYTVL